MDQRVTYLFVPWPLQLPKGGTTCKGVVESRHVLAGRDIPRATPAEEIEDLWIDLGGEG